MSQPPSGFPGQQPGQWGQPPMPSGPPPQPPPRKSAVPWIITGVAVVAIGAIVATILLWPKGVLGQASGSTGNSEKAGGFDPQTPINEQNIDTIDGSALFFEVYRRQAAQTAVRSITETIMPDRPDAAFVYDTTYDFPAKETIQYFSSRRPSGNELSSVCKGNITYTWSKALNQWREQQNPRGCKGPSTVYGDGIIQSGLGPENAKKVADVLETGQYKGFLRPGKPELKEVQGKKYIRLPVTAKPMKLADGHYWGMQILIWAVRHAGIDPVTLPVTQPDGGGQGAEIVYYIEPETLLPAYTWRKDTPVLDDDGNPSQKQPTAPEFRAQYVRPAELDRDPKASHDPSLITWDLSIK